MIQLEDWELSTLSNPAALYEAVISAKGYSAKAAIAPGDCELLTTDFTVKACVVCATVVHSRREAYLILLDSDEMTALRERLSGLQVALNSLRLLDRSAR